MPATPRRRQLNAFLTDEAREGWRWFAGSQHVTVSALLEALGRDLAKVDETRPPTWLRKAVKEAAVIDSERRSRLRD